MDASSSAVRTVIEGKIYEPKYWPCGDALCLSKNANLDTSDVATQTYLQAMDQKILSDVEKAAIVVTLVSPVGVVGVRQQLLVQQPRLPRAPLMAI